MARPLIAYAAYPNPHGHGTETMAAKTKISCSRGCPLSSKKTVNREGAKNTKKNVGISRHKVLPT
jgi:hypothetical protein